MTSFYNAILWSLVAELVYYTLYPAMFPLLRRFGWRLVGVAYAVSFGLICSRPHLRMYHDFGPYLTWAVGLPCWLLGCMLAKDFTSTGPVPSRIQVWSARLLVWTVASACSILRFHSSIGYPWTLNFFALLGFFWLRLELRWFQAHSPPALIEKAGSWSYSLYLCHVPAFFLVLSLPRIHQPLAACPQALWGTQVALSLLLSFCFYVFVERPSHFLARTAARALGR